MDDRSANRFCNYGRLPLQAFTKAFEIQPLVWCYHKKCKCSSKMF